MRLLDFTPLGCGTGAGAWASAGMASVMKARPAARTVAKTLRFMEHLPGMDCSFTAVT